MKKFKLPALLNVTSAFCTYNFNNKAYKFNFAWSDSFCLLDIYVSNDVDVDYILKGFPLVPEIDLLERVKDPAKISGKLFLHQVFGEDISVTKENFSSDFELVYFEKDEEVTI